MPLNSSFMNGTVEGEDVWIPMDCILGGQERCGYGWHMFVECLAEGRGVSLPAGCLGAARAMATGVGAYSRIRKQFRVPIAEFGGIQEGTLASLSPVDFVSRSSPSSSVAAAVVGTVTQQSQMFLFRFIFPSLRVSTPALCCQLLPLV